MWTTLVLVAPCLPSSSWLHAQLPATDMILIELSDSGIPQHFKHLTSMVGGSYRQQPVFVETDVLLISSDEARPEHPDIWMLDLQKNIRTRFTNSSCRAFSPRIRPGTRHVTFVGQEPDSSQFLYAVDRPGAAPVNILPEIPQVGYYSWASESVLALFLVGQPHRLEWVDLVDGMRHLVCLEPGRSFQFDDKGQLVYIQKVLPDVRYVKRFDPATRRSEILVRAPQDSEDLALLQDGTILMTQDSRILRFRPGKDLQWVEWIDLAPMGIHRMSRIAVGNHRTLAVVIAQP